MLNRLVSQQPSGPLVFAGTTNEPATVTVGGKPATTTATNVFRVAVPVASGTSTITVVATDSSGNTASQAYEVDSNGTGRSFTYDANGNMTNDGTRTFEWDARNQLVAVSVGTHRSEFMYDGRQRRVRIIGKEGGVAQSDTKVIWCQTALCEERAADETTVTRRALAQGEQVTWANRHFTTDHLGSVTSVTDGGGVLLASYAFDPWGRQTLIDGTNSTRGGFTGHQVRSPGGLLLSLYRAYDPDLGRWISEDPLKFVDGPNTQAYVQNKPTAAADLLGLSVKIRCEIIRGKGLLRDIFVPHSVKTPLESRIGYAYPGQVAGQEYHLGWYAEPSRVGRVLDDGSSQVFETTDNLQGSPLTRTRSGARRPTPTQETARP